MPPAVIPAAVDAVRQVASNQSWKAKVKQVLRGAIGTQRFNWHIQYGRTYKFAKVASPINHLNHCQCFQMKPSVESWLGGQSSSVSKFQSDFYIFHWCYTSRGHRACYSTEINFEAEFCLYTYLFFLKMKLLKKVLTFWIER